MLINAGSYTVAVDWTKSLVTLNKVGKPSQPLMWIMVPGETGTKPSKVRLTFDVAGSDHVLRTIQYETFITPNLDAQPKQRVEGTTTIGE